MSRKRARGTIEAEVQKKSTYTEKTKDRKNVWVALALISIFFLVLFFNTYFNLIGEVGINPSGTEEWNKKFLLSGPDPYYNSRSIQITLETGSYPWGQVDHMLNYPVGSNGAARPPLMNMLAIVFSQALTPFMSQGDAIGYSMQFIPALFGALLVFPIYFIGKTLFSKKVGLVSALLIAIIPIHIASGHGSAFTLFDHDSINLFLCACVWLFYILGLKSKDNKHSLLYGILTGVSLGALSLTWISAQFIYIIIVICFAVQIVTGMLRKKMSNSLLITTFLAVLVGYLIYLPLSYTRALELTLVGIVGIICLAVIILKKYDIPYILSMPALALSGVTFLGVVYYFKSSLAETTNVFLSGIVYISELLFGAGVYGSKVDLTIAEATTFDLSRTAMSFGPALYWIAMAGFVFVCYLWIKDRNRSDLLFFMTLYIIEMQILGIAGRFLNDLIPLVVVFSGFVICYIIEKADFKNIAKNMRAAGSLRRSIKAFGFMRFVVVLFVAFIVVIPNTIITLDAAIPAADHQKYFGNQSSPFFALSLYKEIYWVNAFDWLSQQDTEIENPEDRPAFISWWDYGFYCSATSEHPTVADNFQEGIPAAANFQTAASEDEAVCVLAIRLLEGNIEDNGGWLSLETRGVIEKYLPIHFSSSIDTTGTHAGLIINETNSPGFYFMSYIEDPKQSPSYDTLIAEEYGNTVLRTTEQNAKYHDCCKLLLDNLDSEEITQFYLDVEKVTGYSIRYYGVEGYDMNIFPVFSFLADKGTHGFSTQEDDYQITKYTDKNGDSWTEKEVLDMPLAEREQRAPFSPSTQWKDAFYETMVYRAYQEACGGMKHFRIEYLSPYGYPGSQYTAVLINKYYPGCYINGSVTFKGVPMSGVIVGAVDEYGIIHDRVASTNGTYKLLSVGGNISLSAIISGNILAGQTNITITPEQANRLADYNLSYDIEVQPASIQVNIFNKTTDNMFIIQSESYVADAIPFSLDANNSYKMDGILPGNYKVTVFNLTAEVHNETFTANPGTNMWNLTIPDALG